MEEIADLNEKDKSQAPSKGQESIEHLDSVSMPMK